MSYTYVNNNLSYSYNLCHKKIPVDSDFWQGLAKWKVD